MQERITDTIKFTVANYEKNELLNKMWNEPIIEIVSSRNKGFESLREIVSPEHFKPEDILPDAKSVVCFFIPFRESIVNSNINGTLASEEWAEAYVKTNDLIQKINDNIEILMKQNGYKAGKIPATHNFDEEKLISNWSHRHVAHIAGLGAFGINNMLITERGCCGRFGSIITNYEFGDYKQAGEIRERCLNKINGSCGMCQKKCIVNAFENNGYNRHKCYEQCLINAERHKNLGFADVCGKCLVGLPCSTEAPMDRS